MFYLLSEHFGWTPDEIRNLTFQELIHYFNQLWKFADAGKSGAKDDVVEKQLNELKTNPDSPLPAFSITTAEKNAWLKAGMPNISQFLRQYRAKNKR